MAAEPLSTSTTPSLDDRATTLPGAPPISVTRSVSFSLVSAVFFAVADAAACRVGVCWQPARPPTSGTEASAVSPPTPAFRKFLRSIVISGFGDEARAVCEARLLDTELVEDR